jgi:predicted homoserine dehydrogenase-like protein
VPNTIARAALLGDATLRPVGPPSVEVITAAKIDLQAGQTLDGIGHYMTYGLCENSDVARAEGLLPIGLAEGCRLMHNIPRDQAIRYADVEIPQNTLSHRLRAEQDALWPSNS